MEGRFYCRSRDGKTVYSDDGRFIYAERNGKVHRLEMFDRHYYKLRVAGGVPILEIDGLRMQPVRDFKDPLEYAKLAVKELRIPRAGRASVLDTCMGLGYTAMEAAENPGVGRVVACEIAKAVITLAKWNPLGEGLSESGKIKIINADISERIKQFKDGEFPFIIHDPPRFSHAPALYSAPFYREMFRVCRPGGRIFHYVGSVGEKKGRNMWKGAMKRMEEAGFRGLRRVARLQGITAMKPGGQGR